MNETKKPPRLFHWILFVTVVAGSAVVTIHPQNSTVAMFGSVRDELDQAVGDSAKHAKQTGRSSAARAISDDSEADAVPIRESGDLAADSDDSGFSDEASSSATPADDDMSGGFRAGTLTAGSIDDNAHFDEFRSYLSSTMQSADSILPEFEIGRRIAIQVVDSDGNGIGDARVMVRSTDLAQQSLGPIGASRGVCLDARTGSDGRTLFLSGIDAPDGSDEFLMTVEPPQGGEPVSQRVSMQQTPWTVTLPHTQARLPIQLDLALVIDTTGSMGDELEYLKVEIDNIAAAIHERFPNVNQRYALVLYRDAGDQYVTRTFDFTASLDGFRKNLAAQSAAGGGDYPEAMHLALEQAEHLSWRTSETARVLFLVADAPPHVRFAERALTAVKKLRRSEVTIFPVAASGVREQAEFLMRGTAFLTQGQYLFLTDHSGVGNAHAQPNTPSYSVEKLNQLMIRMIATELAGKTVFPRDIIAVEEGSPATAPQPLVYQQEQTATSSIDRRHFATSVMPAPASSRYDGFRAWCKSTGVFRLFVAAIAIAGVLFLESRYE